MVDSIDKRLKALSDSASPKQKKALKHDISVNEFKADDLVEHIEALQAKLDYAYHLLEPVYRAKERRLLEAIIMHKDESVRGELIELYDTVLPTGFAERFFRRSHAEYQYPLTSDYLKVYFEHLPSEESFMAKISVQGDAQYLISQLSDVYDAVLSTSLTQRFFEISVEKYDHWLTKQYFAEYYIKSEGYDQAIGLLQESLSVNRENYRALNLWGRAAHMSGDVDTALRVYNVSLAVNPSQPNISELVKSLS